MYFGINSFSNHLYISFEVNSDFKYYHPFITWIDLNMLSNYLQQSVKYSLYLLCL